MNVMMVVNARNITMFGTVDQQKATKRVQLIVSISTALTEQD